VSLAAYHGVRGEHRLHAIAKKKMLNEPDGRRARAHGEYLKEKALGRNKS